MPMPDASLDEPKKETEELSDKEGSSSSNPWKDLHAVPDWELKAMNRRRAEEEREIVAEVKDPMSAAEPSPSTEDMERAPRNWKALLGDGRPLTRPRPAKDGAQPGHRPAEDGPKPAQPAVFEGDSSNRAFVDGSSRVRATEWASETDSWTKWSSEQAEWWSSAQAERWSSEQQSKWRQ